MVYLHSIINSGLRANQNPSDRRAILLTNQISFILFSMSIILFFTYYHWYGWNFITSAIPITSILLLCPLVLNYKGKTIASRVCVCLSAPILTMAISVYSKILCAEHHLPYPTFDHFTFRLIILASCVFPFILFTLKEIKLLLANAFIGLAILMAHDPLNNAFNVGYGQSNFIPNLSSYYFINIIILITYCIIVGAVIFLKMNSEQNELQNAELINNLNRKNEELQEKNAKIEAQSVTLLSQRETLHASEQKLIRAYAEIEIHKNQLFKENKNLSEELIEKNKDLLMANAELVKYNNELRQFSYTVSHNLRGPVASLLGLSGLLKIDKLDTPTIEILSHIKKSVVLLDTITHDLSKIIDIRNDIFCIRQKIDLVKEMEDIKLIFRKEINNYEINISCDLTSCANLYSVKPMVHSILYNLVSNSIKYRSLERKSEILIKVQESPSHFVIAVTDNGLGIDLANHKADLFKLYKRFHYQTEGKGLGLYLVKLQCEALGGYIDVDSELNKSTTFTVHLVKPDNIQMQILHEEHYAKIFYDAKINATGVKWYAPATSEQYRKVFNKCLDFLIAYHTPNWVYDISEQGSISLEDQHWMFKNILPIAAENGLKRIACIRPKSEDLKVIEYLNGIKTTIALLNLEQSYFSNFEEGFDWIMEESEKAAVRTGFEVQLMV